MALQNIGASNRDDAFYRYKMPKLMTKIEGRGNGIKTNLVNMVEVAKALARPASYTTKYFGCELGAQSKFEEKTGTSIVNGAHDNAKLVGLLENFIKKYVQCYGCGNPETEIVISKSQLITLKCAACGFVSDVDMRDKLTTFILKNPPEQKKTGKDKKNLRKAEKERLKEGEAIDEDVKKTKKEGRKKGQEDRPKASKKKAASSDEDKHSPSASQADDDDLPEGDGDSVQWHTDTSAEAAQQRIKEQLTSATSEMVMLDNGMNEGVAKSKENKTGAKQVKAVNEGEQEAQNVILKEVEDLNLYNKFVKEFKDCLKGGFTASEMASCFFSKSGPQDEVMNAYFEALFDGITKGLTKEVSKKKQFLRKVVVDESSQFLLLGAIEAYCGSYHPDAGKEVALVLKMLYDLDILEEEQILGWYDKVTANKLDSGGLLARKNAKPFVEWLQNAEAESDKDE
eukprot:c26270_g2_i1 orf=791-2155(-)